MRHKYIDWGFMIIKKRVINWLIFDRAWENIYLSFCNKHFKLYLAKYIFQRVINLNLAQFSSRKSKKTYTIWLCILLNWIESSQFMEGYCWYFWMFCHCNISSIDILSLFVGRFSTDDYCCWICLITLEVTFFLMSPEFHIL